VKHVLVAATLVGVVAIPMGLLLNAQKQDRPLDPIVLTWDAGPDKIDVAKYPAEMKKRYKIFSDICSRCHPLARAINCDFVLEDDWERYIKRMMRRAGTKLISPDDAEAIFEFVTFDSKLRKKELYDRKLAALH
jgi:hypothetical protein